MHCHVPGGGSLQTAGMVASLLKWGVHSASSCLDSLGMLPLGILA